MRRRRSRFILKDSCETLKACLHGVGGGGVNLKERRSLVGCLEQYLVLSVAFSDCRTHSYLVIYALESCQAFLWILRGGLSNMNSGTP
jgi:hypothetical protein